MYPSDYRNLLLLGIGVVVGIVSGPRCLGWFAPDFYQQHFIGAVEAQAELATFDQHTQERRARLAGTGVTDAALEQFDRDAKNDPQRGLLEARVELAHRAHADRFVGWTTTMVMAMLVVMMAEVLAQGVSVQRNLATARYALLAVWLAIVLAVPSLLHGVQVVFGAILVIVVGLAAMVPLSADRTRG